ncbi:DUF4307 domain-containing protein [Actinotalea sp. Marseille-Q4924]|uniref:DUF4307 domain-containing protein n=1 Tax=Actinotalea sp. Marseille-Q4924 TaxID=2866571 RepID=UPI001CE3F03F|nr:DUF4307 domain-containing protein [Actinotalea sp. Marseille-Q4924]
MDQTPLRPPPGRYGPIPDERRRRAGRAALWVLGALGVAGALWIGVGAARTPVTWTDVGFSLDGADRVEVVFEVARTDPSVPVRCTVQALNQQYAQVGLVEVDVPPATATAVRLSTTVRTSEQAVTGIVDTCVVVDR